jgi:hypothetical protein
MATLRGFRPGPNSRPLASIRGFTFRQSVVPVKELEENIQEGCRMMVMEEQPGPWGTVQARTWPWPRPIHL